MKRQVPFKKPTIKATSRAYVHLFEYFPSSTAWLAFRTRYRVEHFSFGVQRNGDCAVRVIILEPDSWRCWDWICQMR